MKRPVRRPHNPVQLQNLTQNPEAESLNSASVFLPLLLKPIPRLQFAPIHPGTFALAIGSNRTGSPTEKIIGTERKYHRRTVHFCLDAYSFIRRRKGKVERLPVDHGIGFADV